MHKIGLICTLLALSAAPALAAFGHGQGSDGGAGDYMRTSGTYQGLGGEFQLTETAANPFTFDLGAYAPTTHGFIGMREYFQTFCLETNEEVDNNVKLWVSTETRELNGTFGSHAWEGGQGGGGDDLDSKTAWVYSNFARGVLTGYNYGAGGYMGLTRAQTAGSLQRYIWATEGEGGGNYAQEYLGITLNANQQALIQIWENAYKNSGWTGIGDVRVLQAYSYEGEELRQDCLVLIVPTPGATPLAVLGMTLLTALRRR